MTLTILQHALTLDSHLRRRCGMKNNAEKNNRAHFDSAGGIALTFSQCVGIVQPWLARLCMMWAFAISHAACSLSALPSRSGTTSMLAYFAGVLYDSQQTFLPDLVAIFRPLVTSANSDEIPQVGLFFSRRCGLRAQVEASVSFASKSDVFDWRLHKPPTWAFCQESGIIVLFVQPTIQSPTPTEKQRRGHHRVARLRSNPSNSELTWRRLHRGRRSNEEACVGAHRGADIGEGGRWAFAIRADNPKEERLGDVSFMSIIKRDEERARAPCRHTSLCLVGSS